MKKLMTTSLASLLLVGASVPAMTTSADAHYRHYGRGGLVAGAIIGLSAAAIIANSGRVDAAEHHRWRERCDGWAYRCNRGDDRACEAFEARCGG